MNLLLLEICWCQPSCSINIKTLAVKPGWQEKLSVKRLNSCNKAFIHDCCILSATEIQIHHGTYFVSVTSASLHSSQAAYDSDKEASGDSTLLPVCMKTIIWSLCFKNSKGNFVWHSTRALSIARPQSSPPHQRDVVRTWPMWGKRGPTAGAGPRGQPERHLIPGGKQQRGHRAGWMKGCT